MSEEVLNCGYVALVDSAPLIIAQELGFAAEEGLAINLVQQPSWSALRDMLALGHLDAAQMLSPMPVAMSLGMGGFPAKIDALMVLAVNGTVFGLAKGLADQVDHHFGDPRGLPTAFKTAGITNLRIGIPFHFSMHRLLLDYWRATAPDLAVETIAIPPPRMADAVAEGRIDAFWVGEPWGSAAVHRDVGQLMFTGSQVWSFAPEKVLAARHDMVEDQPKKTRRLMRAIYHAARWLDTKKNKPLAVEILARSEHLNLAPELIDPAITGHLTPAQGAAPVEVEKFQIFHRHAADFPWRSQAAWIAAQLGADDQDIEAAKQCFRSDLYRKNLDGIGVDMPGASEKIEGAMAHETAVASSRGHMILGADAFFDGRTFEFTPKS